MVDGRKVGLEEGLGDGCSDFTAVGRCIVFATVGRGVAFAIVGPGVAFAVGTVGRDPNVGAPVGWGDPIAPLITYLPRQAETPAQPILMV